MPTEIEAEGRFPAASSARTICPLRWGLLTAVLVALAAPGSAWSRDVEVVVRLDAPGLASARAESQVLSAAAKRGRLELGSRPSAAYLAGLVRVQDAFQARLRRAFPSARVGWRYQVTLNAVSVVLPARDLRRLARLPGVAEIYRSATYRAQLNRSVPMIGAPQLWADGPPSMGEGAKIAILDTGVDQTHPFFAPAGFEYPPGFPKGQTAYTTPKVIVARAFAQPGTTRRNSLIPIDEDGHGTHVAGIAAGNSGTPGPVGLSLSGVAPRAYIGNYRVLTVALPEFCCNGNAPEIARAIEAAVRDGMDVINLSIGEVEIEPSRDVVALAIRGAAQAGVVTVAAAGNDFDAFGPGSVGSPASAADAIAVGAVASGREEPEGTVVSFSSGGPAPVSLRLKPDVMAPGGSILSSSPGGEWKLSSGTSMASPHVAGAVALLRRRHPDWSLATIRSALVTTARQVGAAQRTGGGLISLPRADRPLITADPSVLSFGLVRPGRTMRATVRLTDAGGGAGTWLQGSTAVTVPGTLAVTLRAPTAEGDVSGVIELRRGDDVRMIPYWFRVEVPRLPAPSGRLTRTGTYSGSTLGRPSRVETYRYPDVPGRLLRGPEQVFRVVLRRPVDNFGVAVLHGRVQPRVVRAGDENRLVGYAGLPMNINPYGDRLNTPQPVAGAERPRAGAYDIVFDSPRLGDRFTFRFWVNDRTRPTARLLTRSAGDPVRVRVADAGAGVDPRSLRATVDGISVAVAFTAPDIARVNISDVDPGARRLVFSVSDYQESKNTENIASVLPNTRTLRATIKVR
jgi:subtilisin family serine protease